MLSEKVVWCYRHETNWVKITKFIVNYVCWINVLGCLCCVIQLSYFESIIWVFCLMDIQIVLFDTLILCLFHEFWKNDDDI